MESLRTHTEDAFAERLADEIARDASRTPVDGPLLRVVLRWHRFEDPMYFVVHLLGENEVRLTNGEPWLAYAWDTADRDLERSERVASAPGLYEASLELTAIYDEDAAELSEAENAAEARHDGAAEGGASRAIKETVRRLPDALRRHQVPLAEEFAVTAMQFEGTGGLSVLQDTAPPRLLELLARRGELPAE